MINVAGPTPTHREINLAQVPLLFRQVAAAVASLKTGVIMTSNGRRRKVRIYIFFLLSVGVSKKTPPLEVPLLVQENDGVQRAPKALARAYAWTVGAFFDNCTYAFQLIAWYHLLPPHPLAATYFWAFLIFVTKIYPWHGLQERTLPGVPLIELAPMCVVAMRLLTLTVRWSFLFFNFIYICGGYLHLIHNSDSILMTEQCFV